MLKEEAMHRRQTLTLGIVGVMLVLGAERSWAGPPDPTPSDSLFNTAGGTGALSNITNGSAEANTAFGYVALSSNTWGSNNTAFGERALKSNLTGYANTALGLDALGSNNYGKYNTAVGAWALQVISGQTTFLNPRPGDPDLNSDNTAVGNSALSNLITGQGNTAVGSQALLNTQDSIYNTAVGFQAGINLDPARRDLEHLPGELWLRRR
jgi:hypothetical protein